MVVGYLNSLLLKSIRSWLFGICDILRRRASPDKTTNRAEKIEKEERVQVVSHVHGKTFPYNHLGFQKTTRMIGFKERMIDLPGSHLAVFFIHRDLDRLCTLEYNLLFFNNFSNKTWVKGGRMTISCYSPPRCLAPFPSCWNKSEKFPSFSFIQVL